MRGPAPLGTRLALGAALVLELGACKPSVHGLHAEPNVICAGESASLSWDATAGGELTAKPSSGPAAKVDRTGSKRVTPSVTTRYRLEIKNVWGADAREVDVEVHAAPSAAKTIGASVEDAVCTNGERLAVTAVAPDAEWDEHLRVHEVALPSGVARHYRVEHLGKIAELDPGARSPVFDGLPVRGQWSLSTPLAEGEICGPDLPRNLAIDVYPSCQP